MSLWEPGLPTCLWLLRLTGNSLLPGIRQSQKREFPPGPGGWTMDLHPSLRALAWTLEELNLDKGDGVPQGQSQPHGARSPHPTHLPTPAAPAVTAVAKAVARSNVLLAWSKARGGNQRIHLRKRRAGAPRDTQSPAGVGVQFVPAPPPPLVCGHRQVNPHLSPLGRFPTLLS
ncbi:unnamed protein product [Rangifer tarandus platyrhynchus]|uniref:Uncharacterized protein n=2 Tax=Rangifer tarandus platyrhynchus TaxID=3082113 RepID=A0ABN8Z9C5_RANTA|nr:unnamed protein product [Rangifer tarandus platyrhynchus]